MGVRIDPLTMAETVAATEKFVRDKKPLHLMGVNADKLNQCATDEAIKKIVNESESETIKMSLYGSITTIIPVVVIIGFGAKSIFTFMFGLMGLMQPSTLKLAQHGSAGLVAIILVAVAGGAAFGFVNKILLPTVDENGKQHRRPLWLRIVLVLGALVAWILVYMLVAFLPNAINPVLNAWAYLILGVATFFGDVYFRQRYHIVGGFWGSSANRRRR